VARAVKAGAAPGSLKVAKREETAAIKPVLVRPSILITDRQLRDVSADAVKALVASNSPPVVFQRGGALVRVGNDHRGPAIEVMSDGAVRGRLARVADWYRLSGRALVATNPTITVVRDILTLPRIEGVPKLNGIVQAPSFAPNGSILTTPGYDPASEL